MLSYLLLSIFVSLLITVLGLVIIRLLKISRAFQSLELIFFEGFGLFSLIASYGSIIVPINGTFLIGVVLFTVICAFFIRDEIGIRFRESVSKIRAYRSLEMIFLVTLICFVLLTVIKPIATFDTALYHSQNIKWIRSFEVVPGLGNLHFRFAFNSMFFPVSALFSFEPPPFFTSESIVMYPLNSVAFIVMILGVHNDIKRAVKEKNIKEMIFLVLVSLISFLFLKKHINSPSPDVIAGILVVFVLRYMRKNPSVTLPINVFVVVTGIVLLSITFKLSTLFLALVLLPFLLKNKIRYWVYTASVGLVILVPYFVRNYYLSGYLIFPLATIDVFSVVWKLPVEKVILESNWITSWARIPNKNYVEVLALQLWEWIPVWFLNLKLVYKIAVCSQIVLAIQTVKHFKNGYRTNVLLVILASIIFWFVKAPDVRFAYGFLIIGTALVFAELFAKISFLRTWVGTLIDKPFNAVVRKFIGFALAVGAGVFMILKLPEYGLFPSAMTKVETKTIETNFDYFVPITSANCFYHQLPCTPYPKDNIQLRGETIEDGFILIVQEP